MLVFLTYSYVSVLEFLIEMSTVTTISLTKLPIFRCLLRGCHSQSPAALIAMYSQKTDIQEPEKLNVSQQKTATELVWPASRRQQKCMSTASTFLIFHA